MNLNNVDLNKIRVFHSVVKNGSYQLAGEELGLTRSAISQSMTTLESQLGVQLFQRKGRRLFPTKNARSFSEEFANYQKSLVEALRKIKNPQGLIEGTLRIGAYYEFAKSKLSTLVKNFSQTYPESRFRFIFDSPSRLQSSLEQGLIDMSFSIFPHQSNNKVESLKIMKQELVLVAPLGWGKKATNLESLLSLPIIEYYSSHCLLPRWIKVHFSNKRLKLNPKIFAASADMVLQFVEQGVGVGVVPLYLLSSHKNIEIIRPTNKKLIDHIWLNQFRGQFESSAHKQFSHDLKEYFTNYESI